MKKLMVVLITVALVIGILLAAGCGGSSIEGTYEYKDPGGGSITLVLSSGKSVNVRRNPEGQTLTDTGTYKVSGSTLTTDDSDGGAHTEFKVVGNALVYGDEDGITLIKK